MMNSEDAIFSNHMLDTNEDTLSDIDEIIDEGIIDEIKMEDRICSAMEDYDDGQFVFSEVDLPLWKRK